MVDLPSTHRGYPSSGRHDSYAHAEGQKSVISRFSSGRGVQTDDYRQSKMADCDHEHAKQKAIYPKETVLEEKERRYHRRVKKEKC